MKKLVFALALLFSCSLFSCTSQASSEGTTVTTDTVVEEVVDTIPTTIEVADSIAE